MGAVSLFRNLEPSGLLLANVWALPVLIEATLLRLEDWSLLCRSRWGLTWPAGRRMWRRWQALMVR